MNLPPARQFCCSLFLETLASLKISPRLRQLLCHRHGVLEVAGTLIPLSPAQAIRVVAIGKAAIEMAEAAAEILAGANLRGIVVAPTPATRRVSGLDYFQGGHPYPNEESWRAAEAVLRFLEDGSPNDLVLFLISGGGSAMLEMPLDRSVALDDLRRFHEVLVTCGASIQEINTLRKHLSAVKGGRLAQRAAPATQLTLYVSDVPDHLPSAVASGPTMPDETTVEDCRQITSRYALLAKFPASIRALFQSGKIAETPKPGAPCFAKSHYHCVLSNHDAVDKVLELARARGFVAEADSRCDEWDFRQAADYLLGRLDDLRQQHAGAPTALVSGGELSCPVSSGGLGGRNQAFVLDCVRKIAGKPIVVLSVGTDGVDGNSPACGAVADGTSMERAAAQGWDPEQFLREANSYRFFEKLGDALVTGPAGTNVRDLRILLAYHG